MLESISDGCARRAAPHYGSPDKRPAVRLETLRWAGELQVPFTTGILIGIGETRASASTRCWRCATCTTSTATSRRSSSRTSAPSRHEDGRLAGAGPRRSAVDDRRRPPRLRPRDEHPGAAEPEPGRLPEAVAGRLNDWGGVSPVTPDHVNPEAPWPHLEAAARAHRRGGQAPGHERLAVYPPTRATPRALAGRGARTPASAAGDRRRRLAAHRRLVARQGDRPRPGYARAGAATRGHAAA
jgi:FO synthase